MIAKSIYETPVRWPEKSAGVLRHCGQIARLPIIYKDAGQALIFLDFLLRFASRQNEYKERIISIHYSFVILFILLAFTPNLYCLQREKLQDFNDYKELLNLQINLKQQDRNIFTMSGSEKSQLIDLADNSNGEAKYGAQNILSFVYGDDYCDCISPIEGGDNKSTFSSFEYSDEDIAKALGYKLTVKPNPARVFTSVDYTLPVGVEFAELQLINIEGKVVSSNKVSGTQGQITIDVRNYKSGSYIFRLFSNEYSISESLIIE